MKTNFLIALFIIANLTSKAQNNRNFYYLIKKKDVENGKLKLIYRTPAGKIEPIKMCYPKLKAEDLHIEGGVPVFHFEAIPSNQYDSIGDCISNNTPLGKFEIDVSKKNIGDKNIIAKIPFRAWNWGISIIPYRMRFPQDSTPLTSDSKVELSFMYGYTTGFAKINHESITHFYFTASAFAGLSTAKLEKETVIDVKMLKSNQSNVAISYGGNLMFGRNNFGISLFLGFEVALGQNSSLWIYQNRPWLGIGVSTNLGLFK